MRRAMTDHCERLTGHLKNVLEQALEMKTGDASVVIFDTDAPLARLFVDAYRAALPEARYVDIASVTGPDVMRMFDALAAGSLVVLVQSTNFRLNEFRVRLELFKRGLKTIEHTHLNRMPAEQWDAYIDAFEYDGSYRTEGAALKARLDTAHGAVVECKGTRLVYDGPMEPSKLNVGDYTGMKNIGGTFPIGEVFTEPQELKSVNGEALVFAYAGEDHLIRIVDPFKIHVKEGILTSPDAPAEFKAILEKIREDEEVTLREFGLGLNRAMSKTRLVSDITAFERQRGLHFSVGAKHTIYAKPGLHRKHGRYHVDVFIDVTRILIDDQPIYQDGDFCFNTDGII